MISIANFSPISSLMAD